MPNKAVQRKPRAPAKNHQLPDPIEIGEILTDVQKRKWKLGKSIGVGGFGEIYTAYEDSEKSVATDAKFVIKIEPHENGPLFSEMHFYHRAAKSEQIDAWMKEKKLKFLGMPRFIASGSHQYKGTKYRFMVMERFGEDLQKLFLANNKTFSVKTVLTLGLRILDVLEYIHSHGYIHADVKSSNLLLGLSDKTKEKVFLVDFGLACRYISGEGKHKEYKENPSKAHDGTIEYTSRDAHVGVHSRRGDLEILGYNMLHWLTGRLPWESHINNADTVKRMKNEYLQDIPKLMKECFHKMKPLPAIQKYLHEIVNLKFDQKPDYDGYRQILQEGLKAAKLKNDGKLEFSTNTHGSPGKLSKRKLNEDSENDIEPPHKVENRSKKPCAPAQLNRAKRTSPRTKSSVRNNSSVVLGKPTPAMLLLMKKKLKKKTEESLTKQPKRTASSPEVEKCRSRRRQPISPELF